MQCPRILLAEDHTLIAELCKKLLEPEYDIVGIVSNGRDLIRAAPQLKPDVVIVDIAMPLLNGLDAAQRVRKMLRAVKIVFLTMRSAPEIVAEAFRRGASAYVVKTCAASQLLTAVRNVLRGEVYLSPVLPREAVDFLQRQQPELINSNQRLTDRQRDILQLLAEGKGVKEVAYILNISTRTVVFHKYRIMDALGVKTFTDLVRWAIRNHLIAA